MSIKTIEIRNGKKSTWNIKEKLKKNGFSFVKTGKYSGYWRMETMDPQQVRYWKRYRYRDMNAGCMKQRCMKEATVIGNAFSK